MMFLARELGKTLDQIMEMSTLEFTLWVAFYQLEGKKKEQQARAMQNGRKYSR